MLNWLDMNKKLGLFVIFAFLSVQIFSFAHAAQYSFIKHKHNGQVCDIYLHGERTHYASPESPVSLEQPLYQVFEPLFLSQRDVISRTVGLVYPRAPPVFS